MVLKTFVRSTELTHHNFLNYKITKKAKYWILIENGSVDWFPAHLYGNHIRTGNQNKQKQCINTKWQFYNGKCQIKMNDYFIIYHGKSYLCSLWGFAFFILIGEEHSVNIIQMQTVLPKKIKQSGRKRQEGSWKSQVHETNFFFNVLYGLYTKNFNDYLEKL
jgi:hypothetical protein